MSKGDFLSSRQLLYELVRIASVSTHEREISLFVEERLEELHMDVTRYGNNLVAALGRGQPTLMLCGHLDTVPPYFPPSIHGRKLFGRGAADDKGGLAAIIDAIARTSKSKLNGTLMVAFVVDEELQSRGAREVIPHIDASFGVVCEPTNLAIINGHKGRLTLRVTTLGRSAHASRPKLGKNAIVEMAHLLAHLEGLKLPKHPILGSETLTASSITSHSAPNVIPDRCTIGIDYRYVPPNDAYSVLKALQSQLPDALIELADDSAHFSRPFYLPEHAIIDLLKASVQDCGLIPVITTMDASTDAARFNEAGVPTVVFGPGGIDQAHTRDEWIDLDELECAAAVFCDLIRRVLIEKDASTGKKQDQAFL
ncbi:MAG: M20 family metallopeptidase [Euryarchaeota archaeon]|nr:M20 family metallopeptidase [Euryarchaeota archaeon]